MIFIPYGLFMVTLTWYATIFKYEKHGWILALVVTVPVVKLFLIAFRWHRFSNAMKNMIERNFKKLYLLDIVLIPAGLVFLLMARYVY